LLETDPTLIEDLEKLIAPATRGDPFEYINEKVKDFQNRNQPVISVDTKKKELIGNYKNAGQEWNKKKEPIEVKVHDFPDPEQGKVIPYGVYDLTYNQGWVHGRAGWKTSKC
jgi:hypothetical protein